MGHWVQARNGLSAVHFQTALLTFGVLAVAMLLTYYAYSLSR